MEKLTTFLKKIGVKSDIIGKLNSDDEINMDELVAAYKSGYKEVISNDPDFIQPIKDEIRGTELSKVEHKLKKVFGLSPDEIKDKKLDDIIQTAYSKIQSTSATTSDELQNKLIELTKENKRLLDEVIPAKENEAKETIKTFRRESALKSHLASKSLIVSPEVVYPAIQDYLNKQFNVDLDDAGQFVVKTKTGLNPISEDGTKTLSFDEIIDKHLTSLNVLKQSNGDVKTLPGPVTQKTAKVEKVENNQVFHLPGLQVAKENAERMKSIRTFGQ